MFGLGRRGPTDITTTPSRRVLGFIFSHDERYVLLMRHRSLDITLPEMLHGIGGILPDDEANTSHWMAMAAREVTGFHIVDWMPAVVLVTPMIKTEVFMAKADSTLMRQAKPIVGTPDRPETIAVDNLYHYHTTPLVRWLVPMLQDPLVEWPIEIPTADPATTVRYN